jgi:hypothetical protein
MKHFNQQQPVFVLREFTLNGRKYKPGQPFPWRRLAVDLRLVRNIFNTGKLVHDLPGTVPTIPANEDAGTVQLGMLENHEAGWYSVMVGGVAVNPKRIRGREAAIEWATAQGILIHGESNL